MNSCIASIPQDSVTTPQPAACQQRMAGAQLSHCTPAAPTAETVSALQILALPNCFSSDWAPKKSVLFVCLDLYMGVNSKYLGYKGPSVFWG